MRPKSGGKKNLSDLIKVVEKKVVPAWFKVRHLFEFTPRNNCRFVRWYFTLDSRKQKTLNESRRRSQDLFMKPDKSLSVINSIQELEKKHMSVNVIQLPFNDCEL